MVASASNGAVQRDLVSSRFGGKLAQRREHAEQYSKGDFNTVLCSFTVLSTRLCTVRRRRAVLAMRDGYLSTCCDWVQQVRQRCFERSFKCLGCGSRWVGAFSEGRFAPHQCCHHVSAAAVLHPSQCCPMPVTVLVSPCCSCALPSSRCRPAMLVTECCPSQCCSSYCCPSLCSPLRPFTPCCATALPL